MATIEELLTQLDLGKYIEKFKSEDIDLAVAAKLSEDDMKDLGLTIGARKKLHDALHSAGGTPPAAAPAVPKATPAAKPPPALPGSAKAPPSGVAIPPPMTPPKVALRPTQAAAKAPSAPPPAASAPAITAAPKVVGLPKAPPPVVAKKPAAAPAAPIPAAAVGGDEGDIYSWEWCFNGTSWPEKSGSSYHERIRLAEGDDPKIVIATSRGNDEDHTVPVMDIKDGRVIHKFQAAAKDLRTTVMDADLYGNIVCAVGRDYHNSNVAVFYDLNSFSEVGAFRGNNEGGLYGVTLITSAAGAMQAIGASMDDCSKLITYDVGTARRAGKPIQVNDVDPTVAAREMKRDPNNPGCFCIGYHDGKVFYLDGRAGKVVRKIMAGNRCDSLRLPASTPGRGVLTDGDAGPVRVFDIGTGRTIHQIRQKSWGAAMYGNTVVTSIDHKIYFWDIAGQPEMIGSHAHDLTYDYSVVDIDMSRRVVVGINCGTLCSMRR